MSRWNETHTGPRGADYDARWAALAEAGEEVHGEADLVTELLGSGDDDRATPLSVLDAGCGTGRVAIELARRGFDAAGTDLDDAMLGEARRKAPELSWTLGDLADVELGHRFDLIVMAGNVMIFVARGTEAAVVANMADHLEPGGLLVAGFQLGRGRLALADYDQAGEAAGLTLVERFATWDREPFADGDYAVSVHRRG